MQRREPRSDAERAAAEVRARRRKHRGFCVELLHEVLHLQQIVERGRERRASVIHEDSIAQNRDVDLVLEFGEPRAVARSTVFDDEPEGGGSFDAARISAPDGIVRAPDCARERRPVQAEVRTHRRTRVYAEIVLNQEFVDCEHPRKFYRRL
jgi:hypothetical protein